MKNLLEHLKLINGLLDEVIKLTYNFCILGLLIGFLCLLI